MEHETIVENPQSSSDELETRLIDFAVRIIKHSELLKLVLLAGILEENQELCRIFTSSLKTARARKQ